MKWYNKSLHQKFLEDLKIDAKLKKHLERYVLRYSKLVLKHARAVNLEEGKIGVLDFNDIVQMGFGACIEAWNSIDWDKIEESENQTKTIVNYLSSNITGRIRRYILAEATGVAIPEYIITRTRKNLMADVLYGNWMYKFRLENIMAEDDKVLRYIDRTEQYYDLSSYEAETMNERISDIMLKDLSSKERDIIRWTFGLEEKKSIKDISNLLGMSEIGVKRAKRRALDKLMTEENKEILKDFL